MTSNVISLPRRISAGVIPLGELLKQYLSRLSTLDVSLGREVLAVDLQEGRAIDKLDQPFQPPLATTINYRCRGPGILVTARYPLHFGIETFPDAVAPARDYAIFFARRQAEFAAQQAHAMGNDNFVSRLVTPNRIIEFAAKHAHHDILLAYFA